MSHPLLSINGLKYAELLEIYDEVKLSARLYFYNRLPIKPKCEEKEAEIDRLADSFNARLLTENWKSIVPDEFYNCWVLWKNKNVSENFSKGELRFKLYISPLLESCNKVFWKLVHLLLIYDAPYFKIGKDIGGLSRPDKIIVYFDDFKKMMGVAEILNKELKGIRSHGVPFTAKLFDDYLLSWGIDPPRNFYHSEFMEKESWRIWITMQLSKYMIHAKKQGEPIPWKFAIERVKEVNAGSSWLKNFEILNNLT